MVCIPLRIQGWANRGDRAHLNGSTYVDNGSPLIGGGIMGSVARCFENI